MLLTLVGIIFYFTAASSLQITDKYQGYGQEHRRSRRQDSSQTILNDPCEFSNEAKRAGLPLFLSRIKWSYARAFPFVILYRRELTTSQMRQTYRPFVPYPDRLKAVSDTSLALAKELKKMKINKRLLKIRERKMLSLAKHFLENHFGGPYKDNYYTGTWMSGPGRQCSQEGIAYVRLQVATIFLLFPPGDTSVLEQVFLSLQETGRGIRQYIQNAKRGIKTGMINSRDDCIAGLQCLQSLYPRFGFESNGKTILRWFHPNSYVFNMTNFLRFLHAKPHLQRQWKLKYRSTFEESIKRILVEHVGRPLDELIIFLKNDHLLHCIPDHVIHGLGSRPVKHVYYNGSRTNQTTLRYMDTGEIMHGRSAYVQVLAYFTTLPYSPERVNQLGLRMARELYSKTIDIAKHITGIQDTKRAVKEFNRRINRPENFFNEKPFPANESNLRAHDLCSRSEEDAKKYCPVRYAAMQKWFAAARRSIDFMKPKINSLFYDSGPKKTTPSCHINVSMSLIPSDAVQSYQSSDRRCTFPARYNIPFFVDRMGPKYAEWSVSAHEASPGHHLQIQGYLENFRDTCDSSLDLLTDQKFTAFAEGWGMYAENPLSFSDMDLFKNHPLETYGLLKAQLWRALRLIIDTGLHHRGMSRDKAVTLFRDYLWETGDIPEKEVKRYQSWAGQAATYMTGQLALWEMRKYAKHQLGKKFDIKEFHYQILRHGQVPMEYLEEHIKMYVECVLDNTKPFCKEILENPKTQPGNAQRKSWQANERRILKLRKYLGHSRVMRYLF